MNKKMEQTLETVGYQSPPQPPTNERIEELYVKLRQTWKDTKSVAACEEIEQEIKEERQALIDDDSD